MRLLPGLLALVFCATAHAHPHSAPSVWVDLEIRDSEVEIRLTIRHDVATLWLGREVGDGAPLTSREAESIFRGGNSLSIDGVRVEPRVASITVPEFLEGGDTAEYRVARLLSPCERRPLQVALRWERFEGASYQETAVMPGLIKYGPQVKVMAVSAREPEYIWHAERIVAREPVAVGPPPPAPVRVPALALVLLAATGLFVYRRRDAAGEGLLTLAVLAGVGAAGSLAKTGVVSWEQVPRPEPPTESQARQIFETLQGNVYRAFDASSEAEIYELLAVSVDASVLPELYADVYESLILREQGGAVAAIERVEPLDGHIKLVETAPDERPRFEVDWSWRVHCVVTHYAHTHERVNEYAATYTVRHDGRSWKILEVEVRTHRRIDPDAEDDG